VLKRLLVVLTLSASATLVSPVSGQDLNATLAAAMRDTQVPAMGALTIRDGKIAQNSQRGVRRIGGSPVKSDDVWHIGSDGKAMTATLIARLVERGLLHWDEPLNKMLPILAERARPEYRKVTLRMLLTHHAGLPDHYHGEKEYLAFFTDKRPMWDQRLAYLRLALTEAPVAPPNTRFSYSNNGFLLAAAIAEHATGESYESLIRTEVFSPLHMTSPGFGMTHPPQIEGHTDGHVARPTDSNPAFWAPAGNIYLTLDDWAKFCIDQINGAHGKGLLLKAQTYQTLQNGPKTGTTSQSGMGWGREIGPVFGRQGPALEHAGSDGTWYAIAVLFPNERSGALITANAGKGMGGEIATKSVLKAVVSSLAPAVKAAKPQP